MSNLYRKSALDKLSNPEQLDKAISITSPFYWLAIIAIALIITSFFAWAIFGTLIKTTEVNGCFVDKNSVCAIHSNSIGYVVEIKVESNQKIEKGKTIAIITVNGEQKEIKTDISGTVSDILVDVGSKVFMGTELVRLTPDVESEIVFAFYVPKGRAGFVKGMDVQIYPIGVDSQKYGYIKAKVLYADAFPADINNIAYVLGTGNANIDMYAGSISIVVCEIARDPNTNFGFQWSNPNGSELEIELGTEATAKIVQQEIRPIDKFLDIFNHN